jgi:hypothetical protein
MPIANALLSKTALLSTSDIVAFHKKKKNDKQLTVNFNGQCCQNFLTNKYCHLWVSSHSAFTVACWNRFDNMFKNDWLKIVSIKDINAIFRTCSKCTHAQIDTTICNKDQDTGPTASGFPSKAQALLPLTLQVIHAITNQEPFELGKDAQKEITCWQSKTQLKK